MIDDEEFAWARICVHLLIGHLFHPNTCYWFCFKIFSFFVRSYCGATSSDWFICDGLKAKININHYFELFMSCFCFAFCFFFLFLLLCSFTSLSIVYSWFWFNYYYPLCIYVLRFHVIIESPHCVDGQHRVVFFFRSMQFSSSKCCDK